MRVNLTDVLLRATEPPPKGTLTLWDTNLKHFGVRISSGGAKTFILLLGSGNRHAIGRFEPKVFGLGQARDKARQILAENVLGRYQSRSVPFDEAKTQWLAKCEDEVKPRTLYDYTRLINRHFPFGRKQVAEITPHDINQKLDAISEKEEKAYAGVVIKSFFGWCEDRHYIDKSPASGVPGRKAKKRARTLSEAELKTIWWSCVRGHNVLPVSFGRIVQSLILSGLRRGECSLAMGEYMEEDILILPPDITKNGREHVLPLGPLAKSLLANKGGYVFPGRKRGGSFNGWSKAKKALDELSGVTKWTLHDIRRTFRTLHSKIKTPQHIAEMLLNHISARTELEATYDRYAYLDEKRDAMLRYEEYMKGVLGLKPASTPSPAEAGQAVERPGRHVVLHTADT
jgi:integrase